ncbi:hypothetical protein RCL1_003587 [Eukaryota sp. TZLM3-RCL]
MRILDRSEEVEADVTWQDQQDICEYNRLNFHRVNVKDEIDAITKEIELLNNAKEDLEMLIADDDTSMYVLLGTAFAKTDEEGAEEMIDRTKSSLTQKLQEKQADYKSLLDSMHIIRERLYSKFKTTINLEIE